RVRIVDHGQSQRFCLFGKLEGVMIDVGGFADEQCVELYQGLKIVARYQFTIKSGLVGGLDELLNGLFVGRGVWVSRVDQYGKVILFLFRLNVPLSSQELFK